MPIRGRESTTVALAALLLAACGGAAGGAARPDIVLVSIDSLRADHLGCYGYGPPTSPTIDRLAAEGVRCERAVSTTSWTLPAHAALFTGLFDSAHGLVDNGLRLGEGPRTLAEVLREAGYQTAGFYGGPYLHPTFGLDRGFETWRSCMGALPDGAPGEAARAESRSPKSASHRDVTGPRTLEAVKGWLAKADPKRPILLFVHLWDVHYDYNPPPEYVRLFDSDYSGSLDASGLMTNPAVEPRMSPRDYRHLLALYDGEIRFTDEILGRILEAVAARDRMQDTLVAVTADHGEEFFEHGGKGHQRTLFDEVVRVPLILRWPGRLPAGRVVREQVRLIDLMPTLLTLAGLELQPEVQGRDMSALLTGAPAGERLGIAPALCELLVDRRQMRALRTNEVKLVDPGFGRPAQLFDLASDPGELRPLSEDGPRGLAVTKELQRMTAEALQIGAGAGQGARKTEIDPELERMLRGLGYAAGGEPADGR
jgi:arylsulfatase A-like enzyme